MATQKLDTELDVCRKYLHFSQRDLYLMRFESFTFAGFPSTNMKVLKAALNRVKYWRTRYNAAMAIEQTRHA